VGNVDKAKLNLPILHKSSMTKLSPHTPTRIKFVEPEKEGREGREK
jgi:hypothetical protein